MWPYEPVAPRHIGRRVCDSDRSGMSRTGLYKYPPPGYEANALFPDEVQLARHSRSVITISDVE